MNGQINKILSIAGKYIGTKESPKGSNNVIFNTRYYGKSVSGSAYPWCCAFIWCLFQDIGAPELFYGGKKTASCTELMNYAKANGQFHTSGFQRGDLTLFDFDGDKRKSEHIGIIEEVKNGSVVTIEGNTAAGNDSNGGEVMRRTRANNLIIGVYRPAYKEEEMDINAVKKELTELTGTGNAHSGWASDAIGKLTELGVFNGDGDGNFGWGQLITREALAQVMYNLIKLTGTGEEGIGK